MYTRRQQKSFFMPTYSRSSAKQAPPDLQGVFEHATNQLNKGTNQFEMEFRPQTCHIYGGNAHLALAVPKRHKGLKPRNYTTHFGILRGNMIATPRGGPITACGL